MAKKIKKIIGAIVIIILLLVIIAAMLFTLYGNQAIKIGIEKGAATALKVGVSVKNVDLSIVSGKFELDGLKILNPEGYQISDFLTMAKAAVKLNTSSLISDTIEIEKIQLDEIVLSLEQKTLTQNNLQDILNNLPKSDKTAPKETSSKPGKRLLIKELVINGVQVNAKLIPVPGKADIVPLKISPIVLKDLGSGKSIDTAELTSKILTAIAGGIVEQGKDLPLDMINGIGKDLARQGQQAIEAGSKAIQEAAGSGKQLIEGIFPLKKDEKK